MKGSKLKGRLQIQFAPMGGKRVWLVNRPTDQTPYSKNHKFDDVVKELKDKGQRYLVWSDGTSKPESFDLTKPIERGSYGLPSYAHIGDPQKDTVVKDAKKGAKRGPLYKASTPYNFSHTFGLLSADDDAKRLVTGIVYKPNELDTQREWMSPDELDKAANWWMEKSQASGKRHTGLAEARVTQSYIAPQDLRIGNKLVKAGSWIVTLRILSKKLWADIKAGVYKGFSMGGYVTRIPGSLPPGLKIPNPSTVNELKDAQPLEVSFVKSAANKEPEYLLLKCALCSG
jgi:hypothetical protein